MSAALSKNALQSMHSCGFDNIICLWMEEMEDVDDDDDDDDDKNGD